MPTFVKALDDVAGETNDQGSRALRGNVARRTERWIRRMLDTGLIHLGRSAAPEIGLNVATEPLAHGPARNPWNLDRSTGGSSGGAAALVAARVVPVAQASDAGGSIRIPASSCGLVGLKVGRERRFTSAMANLLPVRIFTYGAVTRSVRDTARFVAALEVPTRRRKLAPIGLVEGPSKRRLRIGVYTDSPLGNDVHPEVREATLAAARACADLGHHVDEIPCPYDARTLDDFWIYVGYLAFAFILQTRTSQRGRYDPLTFEPWTHGLAAHYRESWRSSLGVLRRLRSTRTASSRAFADRDVLMCPTLSAPPPRIGELAPDQPFDRVLPRQKAHIPFTPIQNVTGEPAVSLPLGETRDALPIGVQLASGPGGEATLLALAYELEEAGRFRTLGGDSGNPELDHGPAARGG